MLVYTSCLANYIPKARVLGKSVKKHHPDWTFVLVLGEPWPAGEPEDGDPFDHIVYYEDLGIDNLKPWIFKHDVVEIATAVKGFAVCHFFETFKADKVIYLDPDIQVFNSLTPLETLLDQYDILLVPHHLKPHSDLHMIVSNELCQMRHGIYNLGFVAFAGRGEGLECAKWWRDRLYHFCRDDVANGLFTDQRWCDFIPAFFNKYHIVKDPGYDAASWNLTDRTIWKDKQGTFYADNHLLRFYHFTGYDSGAGRSVIAHYTERMPALSDLWDDYDRRLAENGHGRLKTHRWPLSAYDDGAPITPHMRMVYRQRDDLQQAFTDPFAGGYLKWYQDNIIVPDSDKNRITYLDTFTNSLAWRLVGRGLYRIECKLKGFLHKDNRLSRVLRGALSLFGQTYQTARAGLSPRMPMKRTAALLLTSFRLSRQIPPRVLKRVKKKTRHNYARFGKLTLISPEALKTDAVCRRHPQKPTLFFDLFFCRGFHGGGEYGKSVLFSLCRNVQNKEVNLWVAARLDDALEDHVWDALISHDIPVVPVQCYDDIAAVVNMDVFDFFFTPALVMYTGYIYQCRCGDVLTLNAKKTKTIGVIHDIRDIELAQETERRQDFRRRLGLSPENSFTEDQRKANIREAEQTAENHARMYTAIFENPAVHKIITVSCYSQKTIAAHIKNGNQKTTVFYSPMKKRVAPRPFKLNGRDPAAFSYALMINAGREEKNGAGAVLAFDRFCSANPGVDLTFLVLGVGSRADLGIQAPAHPDKIIFHRDFLDSARLEYLYANARFLVYPSFSEGFGYPPVEIMSYGAPALVSDKSAIPEICGDAAVYCDPYDVASIESGLAAIVNSPPDSARVREAYQRISARQQKDLDGLTALFIFPD